MAALLPAATSQLTGFGAGLGAGCAATIGVQSMRTWLSPTAQAQHIKKILDETRVFIEQLKEQSPSGISTGPINNLNISTTSALEEQLSVCEAEYKFFLEEISTIGWADIRKLYWVLADLRLLVEKCCALRNDVVKTTNTVYKENKLRDQRQAIVEAQAQARIAEWM
ncbi:hypothetical protein EW026_g8290, partial [Hermanssonia centrifuga]